MTAPTLPDGSENHLPAGPSIPGTLPDSVTHAILNALHGLRFGQVTLIVHDGRVMQIDRTDRFRLQANDVAGNKAG